MERPLIGIPMGDPAGIGPEIALKALRNENLYKLCRPVIIGNIEVLKNIEEIIHTGLELNVVQIPAEGKYKNGIADVISLQNKGMDGLKYGQIQADAGQAAFEYIVKTVKLAKLNEIDAIATTPINKEAIKAAKIDFIGHTEMLAEMTNTHDPLTMFQVHGLRVFFLSRHVSLRKACEMVKKDRLIDYVVRCVNALKRLGMDKPSIAIAGLNPHSGEHGLFGDEEVAEIEPAINVLKGLGINVFGPVPADSVFYQGLKGKYNAVLSLYHDQGHIATKMVDFERTISLTIGMLFLRTSVDHGTAFDIAGKGIASPVSMEEAIRLAAVYGQSYKKAD